MAEEIRILKDFIEKEVPKAPPLYVSVFLMTKAAEGKTSAAEIAEKLEILPLKQHLFLLLCLHLKC